MKKVVLLLILSLISCLVYAQKPQLKGLVLKKGETLSVVFDYSKLQLINGLTLEDFYEIEENYEEGFKDAEKRFLTEANNTLSRTIHFSFNPNREHVLIIYPFEIKSKGDFIGTAIITDKEGNEIASLGKLKEKGGTYGSFLNLMGDGYERLAYRVYMTIKSCAK